MLDQLNLRKPNWMHDHYASSCESYAGCPVRRDFGGGTVTLLAKTSNLTMSKSSYSENYIKGRRLQLQQERPIMLLPQFSVGSTLEGINSLIDVILEIESPRPT